MTTQPTLKTSSSALLTQAAHHAFNEKFARISSIAFGALAFLALLTSIYLSTSGEAIMTEVWIGSLATMGGAALIAIVLRLYANRQENKAFDKQVRFGTLYSCLKENGGLATHYHELEYEEDADAFIADLALEIRTKGLPWVKTPLLLRELTRLKAIMDKELLSNKEGTSTNTEEDDRDANSEEEATYPSAKTLVGTKALSEYHPEPETNRYAIVRNLTAETKIEDKQHEELEGLKDVTKDFSEREF